ncbi:unnamed protein product [Pedinophyceae sp. YPF-701]|nr:unnamed protein product [Pedinophyceae sp. YPF-701]
MGDYWVETQAILQDPASPLVRRPKLKDALLQKPPFKFLHDVISEVQRSTGFAQGLFADHEQEKDLIKDKESKVAYLTKAMHCVGIALNEHINVNPLKVVAGLEPANTNAFLQALGRAATQGDGAAAVEAVLQGKTMPPPAMSPSPRGQAPPLTPVPEAAPAPPPREAPPPQPAEEEEMRFFGNSEVMQMNDNASPEPQPDAPPPRSETPPMFGADTPPPDTEAAGRANEPLDDPAAGAMPGEPDLPPGALAGDAAGGLAMLPPVPPGRPMTARKAPPKVAGPPPKSDPAPADAPAAERGPSPVVFLEQAESDSDSDVEIVEDAPGPVEGLDDGAKGGALVENLRAAHRDLGAADEAEDEMAGVILGTRSKKQGPADLEQIKATVQQLCKATEPLGKAMDFLQEDVDGMVKEYNYWAEESRKFQQELGSIQSQASGSETKVNELARLDEELAGKRAELTALKAQVLRNDRTIERLLAVVAEGCR